ncbi:MAG: hypothetical protein GX442_07695 [Candidatus Riflebacteria bacterium]|nr:hypothetical protein [Candidatus Riflebacteria bacterium]
MSSCRHAHRTPRLAISTLVLLHLLLMAGPAPASRISATIPHRTVFAIKALAENDVWIGTEEGAARFDGKAWTVYTTEDGLPHDVVTSIAVHPGDGAIWFGTFRGVGRFHQGRFQSFTTKNSGLVNDVVYGVTVTLPYVWVATTNGISRFNPQTGEWKTFNDTNTDMNEVWIYSCASDPDGHGDTWFAIWGSGLMKVAADGAITVYQDPDDIFDVDVVRNDGPLHEIQVAVTKFRNVIYAGAYFGLTRYDGTTWNTWTVKDPDSGLPSDFINTVKLSPDGRVVAIGTDKGLCLYDHAAGKWVTYQKDPRGPGGELRFFQNGVWRTESVPQAPAGDFIWAVEFVGDRIWVGTASGLYTARFSW